MMQVENFTKPKNTPIHEINARKSKIEAEKIKKL